MRRVFIIAALLLSSCGQPTVLKPEAIPDVIQVEQNYPGKKLLVVLKDRAKIEKVIAFVNARPNNWSVPLAGPPVGKVYLLFLKDNKIHGNFYVGSSFFGRDQDNFWSQPATNDEIAQLGQLLDLPLLEIINAK